MGRTFANRTVIVTGAGRGLGRAYALLLGRLGADVIVNDFGFERMTGEGGRSSVPADEATHAIISAGGSAIADYGDVTDYSSVTALVGRAISHYGKVDAVINNAGLHHQVGFADMTPEDFDRQIKVHCYGSFNIAHAVWPHMVARGYGRIVLTTSEVALFGLGSMIHYSAGKGATFGLMRSLAVGSLDHGIRVNAIAPVGFTRGADGMDAETQKLLQRRMPAALAAPGATWLAHEDCSLNGTILSCGSGRVGTVIVGETRGYLNREMTIDDVADNLSTITDESGYMTFPDSLAFSVELGRLTEP